MHDMSQNSSIIPFHRCTHIPTRGSMQNACMLALVCSAFYSHLGVLFGIKLEILDMRVRIAVKEGQE